MKNWGIALALALIMLVAKPVGAANECFKTCVTSPDGVTLVQFFEGFSPFVYKDVGGLDTIGYGHLVLAGERIPEPLLGDAATNLLQADLKRTERGLNAGLGRPITQPRFDALSSFAFNVGVGNCVGSSPWRYTNAGRYQEVPDRLMLWVNVDGKPNRGLKVRRTAEGKLYSK